MGGRDVLSRSSSRDCNSQEGQEEPATNKGRPHIDPKSSGEGQVLDPGLSSSLHWTEGWSETKRLQWYELHLDICRNKGEILRSGPAGRSNSVHRQKGSDVHFGNRDGLCRKQACKRVCVQQPKHNGHLRLRRIIQYVIKVARREEVLGVHSF